MKVTIDGKLSEYQWMAGIPLSEAIESISNDIVKRDRRVVIGLKVDEIDVDIIKDKDATDVPANAIKSMTFTTKPIADLQIQMPVVETVEECETNDS